MSAVIESGRPSGVPAGWVGPKLGCDACVLPVGYAGATFTTTASGFRLCNHCREHRPKTFLGGDRLIEDLALDAGERVGVTVSGGKDGLAAWLYLVQVLGPARVVAFNHDKLGLVHPLAARNLTRAQQILGSELIRVTDPDMLSRFRANIAALLDRPDPAMVRVALCAGCRVGISGTLFAAGEPLGITKFVNAASYLEDAPFKAALMNAKGCGSARRGLLAGLAENPGYDHGENLRVIDLDDRHEQKTQLAGGRSRTLYPHVTYLDFDAYMANVPAQRERLVTEQLEWRRPRRGWHFDCLVEEFKDVFYYGLLGYTETDYYLSAQIRYNLIDRASAIKALLQARQTIVDGQSEILTLLRALGVGHLQNRMRAFYAASPYLNPAI